MSYVRKSITRVWLTIIGVLLLAGLSVWQFYLFAIFRDQNGVVDVQGGQSHLWWAIVLGLIACLAGFFVFSVFVRHDTDDELHITSASG